MSYVQELTPNSNQLFFQVGRSWTSSGSIATDFQLPSALCLALIPPTTSNHSSEGKSYHCPGSLSSLAGLLSRVIVAEVYICYSWALYY